MKVFVQMLIGAITVMTFLALVYAAFWIVRDINYSLAYKSMVQETVRQMVKPDALK